MYSNYLDISRPNLASCIMLQYMLKYGLWNTFLKIDFKCKSDEQTLSGVVLLIWRGSPLEMRAPTMFSLRIRSYDGSNKNFSLSFPNLHCRPVTIYRLSKKIIGTVILNKNLIKYVYVCCLHFLSLFFSSLENVFFNTFVLAGHDSESGHWSWAKKI